MARLFDSAGIAALITAAAIPAAAFAQDKADTEVAEIVATASLTDGGVRRDLIGGSATVLTTDDLTQRGTTLVVDALRDVPGVEVSRTGNIGGLTQVRIRGAEANHTLVLVDGVNLASPVQRETDFGTVFAEDGSRIEVLRGQQSALYGSEAIGGVIQYFTPDGRTAPGLRLRGEYGSFNTFSGAASFGGVGERLDYIASINGYTTEGTTDTRAALRDLAYDNVTASAKARLALTDTLRLVGLIRASHVETDLNNTTDALGVLQDDTDTGKSSSVVGKVELQSEMLDGRWTHNLSVQALHATALNLFGGFPYDTRGDRLKALYVTGYSFGDEGFKQKLTGALSFQREEFQQSGDPVKHDLDTTSVVAMYDAVLNGRTALGLSLRNDSNNTFESFTSYRVQASHKFAGGTRIRAAAGTGIQYPTQGELYGFFGNYAPNPNLRPEKSEGWEVGVEQALFDNNVLVGLTWFDSRLTDKIDATGFPITTPVNLAGEANQKGVEVFVEARLGKAWAVDASYTNLDGTADTPPTQTIRRAKDIASLNVNWSSPSDEIRVNLNVRYNGEQLDNLFLPPFYLAVPVTLPAFTVVNLNGEWKLNDTVTVYGRATNLFDETYEEAYSYVSPGREISVGLKARF